jgi:hypothetical protein
MDPFYKQWLAENQTHSLSKTIDVEALMKQSDEEVFNSLFSLR